MMAGFGLIWLLILGGAAYAGFQALQRNNRHGLTSPPPPHRSAEGILRERYARGEIDRDEYETRLRDLRR